MKVEEALGRMKEKGFKHTEKREDMLRLFEKEKRYLSAKEVLEYLQMNHPSMSFDTIYRNLSLFADIDILEVTELEGEKRFRFRCQTHEHHHHLICMDCGKTKHIPNCPMDTIHQQFPDFQITGHKFEIYGKCEQCLA
ncbi:transcriptional repressor [bacterium LRH843]|nr:transcriptional repressor [bacterium LRH843]